MVSFSSCSSPVQGNISPGVQLLLSWKKKRDIFAPSSLPLRPPTLRASLPHFRAPTLLGLKGHWPLSQFGPMRYWPERVWPEAVGLGQKRVGQTGCQPRTVLAHANQMDWPHFVDTGILQICICQTTSQIHRYVPLIDRCSAFSSTK